MTTIGSVAPSQHAALQAARAAEGFGRAAPTVVRDIEAAAAALMSEAAAANLSAANAGQPLPEGAPQLRSPDAVLAAPFLADGAPAEKAMTPEAALMALVGELMATIQQADAEGQKARAKLFKEQMEQMKEAYHAVLAKAEEAEATLGADIRSATEAGEEAERRQVLANEGAERVERLELQLDGLPTSDPAHAQVAAELESAKAELATLQQAAADAEADFISKTDRVTASQNAVNGHYAEADEIMKTVLPVGIVQTRGTNNAELTKLMAQLSLVMTQSQVEKNKLNYQVTMEQLKAQEAANQHRAEEHAKKLEKAAHTNSLVNCIVGILSIVISAVMVFFSPLTGGASAVVAGIFLALAIVSFTTKFDLVGEIFKPFMEHVLKPIAEAVGRFATKFLIKLGMDPKEAEKAGKIFGHVFTAIAVVVIAVAAIVGARSAGVFSKLGSVVAKMANKAFPAVTQAATKASAAVASASVKATAKVMGEQVASKVAIAQAVAAGASVAVQIGATGGRISASVDQLHAAEWLAELQVALAESEQIRETFDRMAEEVAEVNDLVQAILERMSDIASNAAQASASVIANLNFRTA